MEQFMGGFYSISAQNYNIFKKIYKGYCITIADILALVAITGFCFEDDYYYSIVENGYTFWIYIFEMHCLKYLQALLKFEKILKVKHKPFISLKFKVLMLSTCELICALNGLIFQVV